MEELLKKLMKQSELNKESLEKKEIFDKNYTESASLAEEPEEEESQKHEEFNSKKYIEYLDSDMYPISSPRDHSSNRNVLKCTSDKAMKTIEQILKMKEEDEEEHLEEKEKSKEEDSDQ